MPFQTALKNESLGLQTWRFFASAQILCRSCLSRRIESSRNMRFYSKRDVTRLSQHAAYSRYLSKWSHLLVLAFSSSSGSLSRSPLSVAPHRRLLMRSQYACFSTRGDLLPPPFNQEAADAELLVTKLRDLLYQSKNECTPRQKPKGRSRHVRLWKHRRKQSEMLMDIYKRLRLTPAVNELTSQDFDTLIEILHPLHREPLEDLNVENAIIVLEDLKNLTSENAKFSIKDAETLTALYRQSKKGRDLDQLSEQMNQLDEPISQTMYDNMIALLAEEKRMDLAEKWVQRMKDEKAWPPSEVVVGALVDGWLRLGEQEKAVQLVKTHADVLKSYATKLHATIAHKRDDREILESALNVFAFQCIHDSRWNDARKFYHRKRELDLSHFTKSVDPIIRLLADKSVFSQQFSFTHDVLKDTASCKDIDSYKYASRRLIRWFLVAKRPHHAVKIIDFATANGIALAPEEYRDVISGASKRKLFIDVVRVYHRMKSVHPSALTQKTYGDVLRCLLYSKQLETAKTIFDHLVEALRGSTPPRRDILNALYAVCAQTGNLDFFGKLIQMSENVQVPLSHKALTSLMSTYVAAGDVRAAKATFQSIVTKTAGPDTVDFNLLVRTVAMEHGPTDLVKIMEILKHMRLVNVPPDQTTLRTITDIYKDADPFVEKELLHKLVNHPDSKFYDEAWINNIAFTRLVEQNQPTTAAKILLRNDRGALFPYAKGQTIKFDYMTYKVLLDGLLKKPEHLELADRLFNHMRTRCIKPNQEIYTLIALGWAKKGDIQRAKKILQLLNRDLGTTIDTSDFQDLKKRIFKIEQHKDLQVHTI
ncbi:uncharacterized protein BYT42DRAFT_561474 [Radiomyces spectabilis]|uniref:uncharacterized protein n=1 Tax=Radiomyces spectabilis TaxID=64574 RepID=UPI002220EBC6|nr:uncharacterized protein BYT42DRAFT_561474 [Radiomyces spectabilis]KAI8388850.1 hypothetical protein BYT42DRAFT_561474 [Radiomyces spectabilis]